MGLRKGSILLLLPEPGALFHREPVEGDVGRTPPQQVLQGRQGLPRGLLGSAKIRSALQAQTRRRHQVQCLAGLVGVVGATHAGKQRGIEGLHPQRDPVHPECPGDGDLSRREGHRVRLHGPFGVGVQTKIAHHRAAQPGQAFLGEGRRGPASEEHGRDRSGRLAPPQLQFPFDPSQPLRFLVAPGPPTRRSRSTRTSSRRTGRGRRGTGSRSHLRPPFETTCGLLRTNGNRHITRAGAGRAGVSMFSSMESSRSGTKIPRVRFCDSGATATCDPDGSRRAAGLGPAATGMDPEGRWARMVPDPSWTAGCCQGFQAPVFPACGWACWGAWAAGATRRRARAGEPRSRRWACRWSGEGSACPDRTRWR